MEIDQEMFLVKEIEGYNKDFSILISMMDYARFTTLADLKDVSQEEVDYRHNGEFNSIAMLLAHLTAIEKVYQKMTFKNVSEEEIHDYADTLEPAVGLGEDASIIKGKPVEYYLGELEALRQVTKEKFAELEDSWLYQETDFWYGYKGNNFFKWFHVFEDEINHRGQIRLIRKLYRLEQGLK
ncbi:DinB family protein [Bacillus sp. SCS-153A]|uniref:DinB family protein n=1 Tax=Rossellomorea sedimentorum TaxID=3115294 RepID=UPI0039059F77